MDIWNVTSAADFAKVGDCKLDIHRAIRSMANEAFEDYDQDFGIAYVAFEDGNAMVTKWNREHYSNSILPIATVAGLVNEMHAIYSGAVSRLERMVTPD